MGLTLPDRSYPAKLLLFGEYVILDGGSAVSVPFPHFSGKMEYSKLPKADWADNWMTFLANKCADYLNLGIIAELLETHRYVSTIPVGAGLGSSGAVTAALYDAATLQKSGNLPLLKERLALMESFFHGTSSGLDPLVSFTNQAIYYRAEQSIEAVESLSSNGLYVYLLDSGRSRAGKEMIAAFLQHHRGTARFKELRIESDGVIKKMLDKRLSMEDLLSLSDMQYQVMNSMIIKSLQKPWQAGLISGEYAMKLCGAGGGGYYLVFSREQRDHIEDYPLLKVDLDCHNRDN